MKKIVKLPKDLPEMIPSETKCPVCWCGIPWSKTNIVIAVLAVVIILLYAVNRGWVFAAIINGKPLFRTSLNKTLANRYGQQTLEGMITEQLIYSEAKKAGIRVTQKEIDAKEEEIVKSFGGNVTIDDLLKYQGMTKGDFDQQVRLYSLIIPKLVGKDIVVSDDDVTQYIATNSATLVATDEATMRSEAREAILTQRIGEKVQPWFTELKNKAKIFRFIQ